jgi:importin subunit beta-1
MKVLCECTQAKEEKIRHASMEALAKIADLFYQYLGNYMQAILQITFKAASNDVEEVALQAIEFWSTVCEVENTILEDIEYAQENGVEPKEPCLNFTMAALKLKLVDLLTLCLTRQDEYQTEEDWNISAAASTCLSLVTRVVGKDIVPFTMDFISKNINNDNWRLKEASTLAFSAILEVPSSNDMDTLVHQAIGVMLKHLKDPVELVKDTTVFTIGRIALFHHTVIAEHHLEEVIGGLIHSTQDSSRIASKACWAINNIAEQFESDDELQSYPLSKYFELIASTLLKVSERQDVSENNLRVNVYAALSSLIGSATPDCYKILQQIFGLFMQRLSTTLKQGSLSSEEREELYLVQGLICNCIQTLTNKLGSSIKPFADDLMNLLLTLISTGTPPIDDAFLAVDAVIDGNLLQLISL